MKNYKLFLIACLTCLSVFACNTGEPDDTPPPPPSAPAQDTTFNEAGDTIITVVRKKE